MRKLRKLLRHPGLFFRDYLNKRYPIIRNEIACPQDEEAILLKHDLALDKLLENTLEIDIVFTWVDDSDPAWQTRYQQTLANYPHERLGLYAADPARFRNHDELRYSLHSILSNLPWVRRIYLVTDQQCPTWLTPNERIRLIDHKELIATRYLPTFNSHVIEAHLHHIPELSEHFIYFNDDVFVARPLPQSHFFRGNGIASLFVAHKSLHAMRQRGVATPTLQASIQSAALLHAAYELKVDTPLIHSYVPLRKSAFHMAWEQFEDDIQNFLDDRFRGVKDLNMATFLVPWLMYAKGQATPARDICYYFNSHSPVSQNYWQDLKSRKDSSSTPHSFCANDFNYLSSDSEIESHLKHYYS